VKISEEPREPGSGYEFVDKSPTSAIPPQFVKSIESGIADGMKAGVLAGNEIVDLRVVLCDGSYHVEDSNEMAFEIAACMALRKLPVKRIQSFWNSSCRMKYSHSTTTQVP
jgi:elongation factor G